MPTNLAELAESVRTALGLSPEEARQVILRLVPTFEVLSLSDAGVAAGGTNGAIGYNARGALAGNFSMVQLFNPADSGVLIEVDQAIVSMTSNDDNHVRLYNTALVDDAATAKGWVDFRRQGLPAGQSRSEQAAAALGTQLGITRPGQHRTVIIPFNPPVRLGEGQGILVHPSAVNLQANVFWFWRES